MRWHRLSCSSFWIQNSLWAIFGCLGKSITILGVFLKKLEFCLFLENTQNCFAYFSATKYRSEAVLYSKRTAGDPLSSHIAIAMAFFTSWAIKQQKSCILNILKKHPTLGVWCTPLEYFCEFYKLFLGFYKSQFSGTTFVLVEKLLLLVYGLFRNSKNLTFVRVRHHKTLNDAI